MPYVLARNLCLIRCNLYETYLFVQSDRQHVEQVSYPRCNGPMLLSFIVDHPDACGLKHALHLLRSGCCGKVHIFRPLPRQQVPYSTSGYPQLMLVLLKQLCKYETQNLEECGNFGEAVWLEAQEILLEGQVTFQDDEFHCHEMAY